MTPTQTTHVPSLEERHVLYMEEFSRALAKNRLWRVLPEDGQNIQNAIGLFDAQSGLLYPLDLLAAFLERHPFVFVQDGENRLATLDSATRLLWNNDTSGSYYNINHANEIVQNGGWAGLEGWRLPDRDTLMAFAKRGNHPHRIGCANYALQDSRHQCETLWYTTTGACLTADNFKIYSDKNACIFACHSLWQGKSNDVISADIALRGWRLVSPGGDVFTPDPRWQGLSGEALHAAALSEKVVLCAYDDSASVLAPRHYAVLHRLIDIDYRPCRLPKLDITQLTDPEKGLWELWGERPETLKRYGLMARDPGDDLKSRSVAIDFGTSSTVVATDTASGARELLRIGVRDFYQAVQAQHFENPTVFECLDFTAFQRAWTERAYRPALDWDTMRVAHEAQASFRDNPGDTRVLASILPRLKQWALRSERQRIYFTDRKGVEIELAEHTERNPLRGQPLTAACDDPFDPIELYAWYLGMAINWRGRGLFLKYYLSFPVSYPKEVKDRILASFRRGLQRSLPQSLIDHHPQALNDFAVTELASEPAAYAAAALPQLGVEPSAAGVPYAVFDFGGGTTDFDFGLLRWAAPEEEDQGYERVFEHLASSGDNFLGGENLLEHLVYASFKANLPELRKQRIQFTQPLDASPFAGSEAFLARSQPAQTNTVMLAAKLRPFLEGETADLPPQIKLDLIDANGDKKPCELSLDAQALDALLAERIRAGVEAFLAELARLRDELPTGAPIHVLLAGNACRSRHIKALFDPEGKLWPELLAKALGNDPPKIDVHFPLPIDERNPHAPTAKTGVALGLLRLVPGEGTLLIDHVHARHDGQAPFAWFVGRMRRGNFEPVLLRGAPYREWHELGTLQRGVFNLYASASPRALQGLPEGDPELKKHRLDFPEAPDGSVLKLFARAIAPGELEVCAAPTNSELENSIIKRLVLE